MINNQQRDFERTLPYGETSERSPATACPAHKVFKAVDPADNIHRPFPEQHDASFSEEEFRKLIAGIDPETAAVEWACRSPNAGSDLTDWAFFVEATPGAWVSFDDLPEQLADALRERNLHNLLTRPVQRPFAEGELAELVEEIKRIDPATAVCDWGYAELCDPYGMGNVPRLQVGRESFVKASGDRWVWFGDLPKETRDALWNRHGRTLAFPAGLDIDAGESVF